MKWLSPLVVPFLLVSACNRPADKAPVTEPAVVIVTTGTAQEQPMPRRFQVTGELKAAHRALLAPDASGKVVSAPIERGTKLKANDVVLRLDDRDATLALREAEASLVDTQLKLDWASNEVARNASMVKLHAISATDFERLKLNAATAAAALSAATARRDTAQKALEDTVLRTPFAGTVVERLTDIGEFVTSGSGVVQFMSTDQLRLVLNVSEAAVGRIRKDQVIHFALPAFPGETFTGTVKFVGAALRETARDLIVEAEVSNEDGRMKPGMFAEGELELSDAPAVTVPAAALRREGSTHKLFVVVEGRVEERIVEIGEKKGDIIEIRQGVKTGDVVVLTPGTDVTDGVRVAGAPKS